MLTAETHSVKDCLAQKVIKSLLFFKRLLYCTLAAFIGEKNVAEMV